MWEQQVRHLGWLSNYDEGFGGKGEDDRSSRAGKDKSRSMLIESNNVVLSQIKLFFEEVTVSGDKYADKITAAYKSFKEVCMYICTYILTCVHQSEFYSTDTYHSLWLHMCMYVRI